MQPEILASRGNHIFLIQTSETEGYVFNLADRIRGNTQLIDAILKFGYWEPYTGPLTVADIEN